MIQILLAVALIVLLPVLLPVFLIGAIPFAALTSLISCWTARKFKPDGKFIEVGVDRLHYVEYGTPGKPAIVMVHGLGGQLRNFAYLDLQSLAKDYHVILVDRSGAGLSRRIDGVPGNVYFQAGTIALFIAKLGLDRPLVIGHSLGGAIALAIGLNHPEQVRHVGLIAPLTMTELVPPLPFRGLKLRWTPLRRLITSTVALPLGLLTQRLVVKQIFHPEPAPSDFGIKGGGKSTMRSSALYAAAGDLISAPEDLPNMELRYPLMSVPVDMLFGKDDAVLPYNKHALGLQKRLPSVNLRTMPGGHMVPVTQPEATLAWIRDVAGAAFAE